MQKDYKQNIEMTVLASMGKLVKQDTTHNGGFEGREILIEGLLDTMAQDRFVWVGNRFYHLSVLWTKGGPDEHNVDAFMHSFVPQK